MALYQKIGFKSKNQVIGFLSVIMSGQIIYSAFEAFKGTFYNVMLQSLNINNTQMGVIFTLIGSAMFFYIPAGWVNNRYSVKSILINSLLIRFFTMMYIIIASPDFTILSVIAAIWGITDAVFWPAVVNGVTLMSGEKNKGLAFGLLESVRRATEMGMNALVVAVMAAIGGTILIFKGAVFCYTLLIIPMIFFVYKFVPKNELSVGKGENKNKKALIGLISVIKMPTIWLSAVTSLTVYWIYITLIYTIPYLQAVFNISTTQAAIFGIINTGAMGVIAGLVAGSIADFFFKSSIKMMCCSLCLTAVSLVCTIFLPKNNGMLLVNIILLACFSFSIFLAKGIILAPIAEAGVPKEYSGSAMSVGSFAAYSSVFWAYALNGWIIDSYAPILAYKLIFSIGLFVSIIGIICSALLIFIKNNSRFKKELSANK